MQPTEVSPFGDRTLDWRRPHPVTIVVEIGRALRSVLVVVAVVSGGLINRGSLIELALIAGPLIGAMARWYTTRYALDEESVHHQHGLIWRKKQVLPRANVQNVTTTAGILARLTSVVELQISDASANGDVNIRYVTQSEADRLATLLRSSAAEAAPARSDQGVDVDPDLARDPDRPDRSAAGSPDISLATAPAPSGPAVPVDNVMVEPSVGELIGAELTTVSVAGSALTAVAVGIAGAIIVNDGILDVGTNAWITLGLGVAAIVGMAAVQVVVRVLTLGGFRLITDPDRLRIQAGLVTEARITARRDRIQQLRVEREIIHRRRGIERVAFETADTEVGAAPGTRFLATVGRLDGWKRLAREAFGDVQLDEADLRAVSHLTSRRTFVRFLLAGLLPTIALAARNPLLPIPMLAVWLGFGWWFSRARYAELGWAIGPDQYLVRTGVINGRLTLVRLDKVQTIRLDSSYFQRRLGLATVRVSTAGRGFGGLVSLPDVPIGEAEDLFRQLSHRAAATPISETL